MVRASFGRRGGGGGSGGQKRPSTSSRGGPSPKSSRGSYQGTKSQVTTRDRGFRDTEDGVSDTARRDSHFLESKQSYRREDHHQIAQPLSRRPVNFIDVHHSQRYESSSSEHRYQSEGRAQYDHSTGMNSNPHSKNSDYDYSHDRYHNQRDYRAQEGTERSRDHHLQSSSGHGSGHRRTPPRESNHSGENAFFRGENFNNGSGYSQSNLQSSSRRSSPPRSSYSAHRSGHSPRRLDERQIHGDYRLARPRTPPEPQGRARSPRPRGHSPRPRTPPHHTYSRPRTPQGPRTPTGPRTPQRSERLHRSSTPQRQRSPHRLDGSQRQRSPQRTRSPMRVRSPQRPRTTPRQRTPPRNRSPQAQRPRSPRSPQRQRNSPSPNSRQDSFRSSKSRPLRSPRIPSPDARSERDGPRRDSGRRQSSSNRESALKRLGPRMNMTQRLGTSQGTSRSFGTKNKTERDYSSSRSPLLILKCPYCEFSVKSFRDYRQHESSKDHLAAVAKAVEKLEENIKKLRATQLEEVELTKPELLGANEEGNKEGEFCETCQVQYYQMAEDHNSGVLHKSIVEALRPECTICHEKFQTPESFAKHNSVFYHVKKAASVGGNKKDEVPPDENDLDENYFLLDEIVNTDIDKIDEAKATAEVEDSMRKAEENLEKEIKAEAEKEDRRVVEIRRKRKSVVEPAVEEPIKAPVGQNFVRKVEMYFCDLCHKYLPRGHGDFEELISTHCLTQLHREKYEKEALGLQVESKESEDNVNGKEGKEVVDGVHDGSVTDELNNTALSIDQVQDSLEDQDEDDTLIIDNQTNIL